MVWVRDGGARRRGGVARNAEGDADVGGDASTRRLRHHHGGGGAVRADVFSDVASVYRVDGTDDDRLLRLERRGERIKGERRDASEKDTLRSRTRQELAGRLRRAREVLVPRVGVTSFPSAFGVGGVLQRIRTARALSERRRRVRVDLLDSK